MDDDTIWIERLKSGDHQATEEIWQRYFQRVTSLAKNKLKGLPRREMDEEDLALSAFNSLFDAVAAGKFPKLDDRTDLWKILATIANRKVAAQYKRQLADKRGGGKVSGESVFVNAVGARDNGIHHVASQQPAMDSIAAYADTLGWLLHKLNDETLQRIVKLRMEGFNNDEIAEKLGCVKRTIERKLNLIQQVWEQSAESIDSFS